MRIFALLLFLVGCQATAGPRRTLRYSAKTDGAVAATATAAWLTSELLIGTLGAQRCRWCDSNAVDDATRDALRWSHPRAADLASSVDAFALAPVFALGADAVAARHDRRGGEVAVDWLLIAEATALAVDLNQLVKFTVGRERPFVHALPDDEKRSTARPADNNTSFFSGHTTFAFAVATASGTVASLRGYRGARWVWAGGLTLAATTGYLRIAADKHYLTDVVAGAAIGSLVGFLVPYGLHRPRSGGEVGAEPVSRGAMVTWSRSW